MDVRIAQKKSHFLEDLDQQKIPNVEVRAYEIWQDEWNREKFDTMAQAYGFTPSGVPTTFIGDQYWVGFTDDIKAQIETAVNTCLTTACKDAGAGIIDTEWSKPFFTSTAVTNAPIHLMETD